MAHVTLKTVPVVCLEMFIVPVVCLEMVKTYHWYVLRWSSGHWLAAFLLVKFSSRRTAAFVL